MVDNNPEFNDDLDWVAFCDQTDFEEKQCNLTQSEKSALPNNNSSVNSNNLNASPIINILPQTNISTENNDKIDKQAALREPTKDLITDQELDKYVDENIPVNTNKKRLWSLFRYARRLFSIIFNQQ